MKSEDAIAYIKSYFRDYPKSLELALKICESVDSLTLETAKNITQLADTFAFETPKR